MVPEVLVHCKPGSWLCKLVLLCSLSSGFNLILIQANAVVHIVTRNSLQTLDKRNYDGVWLLIVFFSICHKCHITNRGPQFCQNQTKDIATFRKVAMFDLLCSAARATSTTWHFICCIKLYTAIIEKKMQQIIDMCKYMWTYMLDIDIKSTDNEAKDSIEDVICSI